ncbi:MAG: YlxR family protein [Acutalibacteraceae bacterium]|nr:YlxR family protein [Clostridia bacterium]MEE1144814.1 YlxR family protein [Acutalibacteraceae bacterium]
MYVKKIPMRKCIGCQQMKQKNELVRVVHSKDGEMSVDLTGKKSGRGAYICHSKACIEKARKTRQIERAFKTNVPDEIYNELLNGAKDE